MAIEEVTLGCGCFWCFEAILQQLEGVVSATPGYSGGDLINPGYEQVCRGKTGHAEVVNIQINTQAIDFITLLHVFFSSHDPTSLNCQGADRGTQYRSVIFYHNEKQHIVAQDLIAELNASKQYQRPIVTELSLFECFYAAEAYHHAYYQNNPMQPYCQAVIAPKIKKLQHSYPALIK